MKNKLERITKNGYENRANFSKAANYVVKKDVSGPNLSIYDKQVIADFMAIDMSVGAELAKTKHIIVGVVIGVSIISTILLIKELKKKT